MKQSKSFIFKSGTGLVGGLALCLFSGSVLAQSCQGLIWSDEFDGSQVNPNNWEFQTGDGC
ncbi:MAG TPA: hypothetical protein VJ904_05165, partial [Tichowtungia sp.]|nr:hypothetical protein [Tichowtungia sp.]